MVLALVLFVLVLAKVVLFDFSLYKILSQYYKRPGDQTSELTVDSVFPNILIQIPFTNPLLAIEAVQSFYTDLDADKFFIQLIDDSLLPVTHVNLYTLYTSLPSTASILKRSTRVGGKAGALQAGIDCLDTTFDYVAVFDQDFLPTVDWLKNVLPYFAKNIGCVQTHWAYRNRFVNGITTTAGIMLDAHFRLEKQVNKNYGLPNIFNGSAGIWRWQCLKDCGYWYPEEAKNIWSAEDLDISINRIRKTGWRIDYASAVSSSSLLPVSWKSFCSQQMRWCFGAVQLAKSSLDKISLYWFDLYVARFFLLTLTIAIAFMGYYKIALLGLFFSIPCLSTLPYWLMAEDTDMPSWKGIFNLLFFNFCLLIPCTYVFFKACFKQRIVWEL